MAGKLHGFIIAATLPALASVLSAQSPVIQPAEVFPFIPYVFGATFNADNEPCSPDNPNDVHAGCPAVVYTTEMKVYNTHSEGEAAMYQIRFQGFDHARYGALRGIRVYGEYGEDDSWSAKDWIEGVVSPGEIHLYRIQQTPAELSASLIQGGGSVHVNTAIRITYGAGLEVLATVPLVSQRSMITRMPFRSGDLEKTALLLSTSPDYRFSVSASRVQPDDQWRRPIRITAYDTAGNVLCDLWTIEDLSFPGPRLFFIDDEDRLGCLAGKETEGLLEIWRNTPYTVVVGRRVRFLDLSSAGLDAKLPMSFVTIDGHEEPAEPLDGQEPQPIPPTPTDLRVWQSGGVINIAWSPNPQQVFTTSQVRHRIDEGPWQDPEVVSGNQTGFFTTESLSASYEYQARYLDRQIRFGEWSESLTFSIESGRLRR